MKENKNILRVLPVHVIPPRGDKEEIIKNGEELESLIATLGGEIVDRIIQKLDRPDLRTYVGRGKVGEIILKMREAPVDVVVLNAMAKPGQVFNLKTELQKENPQIEVWDRVDLILNIFEKHAGTSEAKLQIELARMRYMGPRIYGMGLVMSRQGGGIGSVGVGETNTELMKRHWRSEMKTVTDQLGKLTKERERQLERRREQGFKTASIVGYTNAGKTTLFNTLTGKNKLSENALFATLNSSVGKVYLPEAGEEILLSDTIGFIRNLPPKLIDAFKSTLLESIYADVLLHVIDVTDPEMEFKINIVNQILSDIGRTTDRVIYIFNKIDQAKDLNRKRLNVKYSNHYPLFVSSKTGEGIEEIKKEISNQLH
jgi:GTP-binding protein HflX